MVVLKKNLGFMQTGRTAHLLAAMAGGLQKVLFFLAFDYRRVKKENPNASIFALPYAQRLASRLSIYS